MLRATIAGSMGTLAEAVWSRWDLKLHGGQPRVFAPRLMVQRLASAVTGHELNDGVAEAVAGAMRAGYGPAWAVAWTLGPGHCRRRHPFGDAILLALLIWAFELTVLPATGATPPLRRWPAGDVAWDLAQCLVFAGVTTSVLAVFDRAR